MNRFVIDAYAWVEYFGGSLLGEKVKSIVENTSNEIFTNVLTIAEMASHFERKGIAFVEAKRIIFSLSTIYIIDETFAEDAGKLHAKIKPLRKHMGLADVIILLTARKLGAKVVTGDEDFKGLKEVIMIK
ncbi:PIN domain-containing protein [Candidatus Woesearchaeota archaeon]|nr:PIN domain-containing protein [Candidatus Woesearchaeota archaeon]